MLRCQLVLLLHHGRAVAVDIHGAVGPDGGEKRQSVMPLGWRQGGAHSATNDALVRSSGGPEPGIPADGTGEHGVRGGGGRVRDGSEQADRQHEQHLRHSFCPQSTVMRCAPAGRGRGQLSL
jgi:hypothetical protein